MMEKAIEIVKEYCEEHCIALTNIEEVAAGLQMVIDVSVEHHVREFGDIVEEE